MAKRLTERDRALLRQVLKDIEHAETAPNMAAAAEYIGAARDALVHYLVTH